MGNLQNCMDPIEVKFGFHDVCQAHLFFWHAHFQLHLFLPAQKNPFFQQNSESTVTLIQETFASTQPLFPKRQTVKPWSTITRWSAIIFWYAKKMNMYGPLRPSQEALLCYTIHKSFSHTRKFSHSAPPTLLECQKLKKKIQKQKQHGTR